MTSASPFADFANARLYFKSSTGDLAYDENGNITSIYSALLVTATLKQKRSPQVTTLPGVDPTAIYLEGYAIDPMSLPTTIAPNAKAVALWSGHVGYFAREIVGRSAFGVEDSTGDKLRGYLSLAAISQSDRAWLPADFEETRS